MKSIVEKLLRHVNLRNISFLLGIPALFLIVIFSYGVPDEIGGCGSGENVNESGELIEADDSEGYKYSGGSCQWNVRGYVKVEESEILGSTNERSLKGIEVRIKGSILSSGGFASWGTVNTNSDGYFSLTKTKNCSKRRFRVDIRFNSSQLRVNKTASNEWIKIYEGSTLHSAGTRDIGTKIFKSGASVDLGDTNNIRRAIAWYMVKKVIDRFADESSFVAFKHKIRVAYPAAVTTPSGNPSAYANGVENTVFIHSQVWNVDTVIHEVMHLWNYQHNSGASNWPAAGIGPSGTHDFQEEPNIAFHEGFAEWAKNEIMYHLWGRSKVEPPTRYVLENFRNIVENLLDKYVEGGFLSTSDKEELMVEGNLSNLDIIERNDYGVKFALYLLSSIDIYELRFGTASIDKYIYDLFYAGGSLRLGDDERRKSPPSYCPQAPNVTFWQLLRVFEAQPSGSWDTDWEVGNDDYGVWRFYDRAADILPNLNNNHVQMFKDLLDVSKTSEPTSYCFQSTQIP